MIIVCILAISAINQEANFAEKEITKIQNQYEEKLSEILSELNSEVVEKRVKLRKISLYEDVYDAVVEAGVKDDMTENEAMDCITNWICENTEYDFSYKHLYYEDILTDGTTVCNGYAEMVKIMCNICGIDCYKVHGYVKEQYHAWNYVQLDGIWYWVDLTEWDFNGIFSKSRNLWEFYEPTEIYHNLENSEKRD